jgi:outer membrane protein assembly factor BamB
MFEVGRVWLQDNRGRGTLERRQSLFPSPLLLVFRSLSTIPDHFARCAGGGYTNLLVPRINDYDDLSCRGGMVVRSRFCLGLLLLVATLPVTRIAGGDMEAAKTRSSDAEKTVEDWPRWRGPRGDGTWKGPKLAEHWPKGGLKLRWRQPIGGGYAGVTVAGDSVLVAELKGGVFERIVCYEAANGKLRWFHGDTAILYGRLERGNGPRAAPTVHDGLVYSMGATGKLNCLELANGRVRWAIDLVWALHGLMPTWGYAASPLVFGDTVIVFPGDYPERKTNASVLALDRKTGKKVWASLSDKSTYATPILIERGGSTQLVCWTPSHIRGLDPATGTPLWAVPYEVNDGISIASPVFHRGLVFVSSYWDGARAIRLDEAGRSPTPAWKASRVLRGLMSQPLCRDGYGYLLDSQFGLTCFELATGKKIWDDHHRVTARDAYPQATLVWIGDGDRALILNAEGELILARLNPSGYTELARSTIIGRTWAHPAYAGRFVYARDDHELVCRELP